jgi:membrane protease YdiL (CAAX protease family)
LTRPRAAAEALLCSGYPTQLAIVGLLSAVGISPMQDGELSPTFVFAVSSIDTAVLIGLILAFLKLSNESPRDVLFGPRRPASEFGFGLVLVPALLILVAAVQLAIRAVAPSLHNVPVNPFESLLSSPGMRIAFITLVVIAGGVREEVQRAFLLHRFEQRLGGPLVGLVVTSLAFGLGHTLQGWDAAIVTALLGAFWAIVYFSRRGVIANVVSHGTFNVLQVLVGLSQVARA